MREYLFRGKRKDTGEWVQGDLVHSQYKLGDTCVGQYGNTVGIHQVDPETVGQFTGLTDKNGKKIFEGDIVRFRTRFSYFSTPFCVKWCEVDLGFLTTSTDSVHSYAMNRCWEYEVIGNIHDNPELMGGADDG